MGGTAHYSVLQSTVRGRMLNCPYPVLQSTVQEHSLLHSMGGTAHYSVLQSTVRGRMLNETLERVGRILSGKMTCAHVLHVRVYVRARVRACVCACACVCVCVCVCVYVRLTD